MKVPVFLFLLLIAGSVCRAQDIDGLLSDRGYVQKQINCILDRGHCDLIGKHIKGLLPEFLRNHCGRCTPTQQAQGRRLAGFMQTYYPKEWALIKKRYGTPWDL